MLLFTIPDESSNLIYSQTLFFPLRKDAILLTDAFDFTDQCLNSALGCYDGHAYERTRVAVCPSCASYPNVAMGPQALLQPDRTGARVLGL